MSRPWIRCLKCGAKSYHERDIDEQYCGRCHEWHHPHAEVPTFERGEDMTDEHKIDDGTTLADAEVELIAAASFVREQLHLSGVMIIALRPDAPAAVASYDPDVDIVSANAMMLEALLTLGQSQRKAVEQARDIAAAYDKARPDD